MKINLGCGFEKKEGYINIDIRKKVNPDMVIDLEKDKLKRFKDNSITEIYSRNCLEHIKPEYYIALIKDMYRVCKDGAIWNLELPYDNSVHRCNIFHYRTYSWHTFDSLKAERLNIQEDIDLERLNKTPCRLVRLFFQTFPFLKEQVKFRLRVLK